MPSTASPVSTISILPLAQSSVQEWIDANAATRGDTEVPRLARFWDEVKSGKRHLWTAWAGTIFLGHISVLDQSDYAPFRIKKIPEIVDLWVQPDLRRRGIARQLLLEAENYAIKKKSGALGLGVGITADFGAAHRLYAASGYRPDGNGVWAQGRQIKAGDKITIDDAVMLMWVKPL